jgi:hypothetical protein
MYGSNDFISNEKPANGMSLFNYFQHKFDCVNIRSRKYLFQFSKYGIGTLSL